MNGGYESIVWVTDREGREFACPMEVVQRDPLERRDLSEAEREKCMNVNLLIGTERW